MFHSIKTKKKAFNIDKKEGSPKLDHKNLYDIKNKTKI